MEMKVARVCTEIKPVERTRNLLRGKEIYLEKSKIEIVVKSGSAALMIVNTVTSSCEQITGIDPG